MKIPPALVDLARLLHLLAPGIAFLLLGCASGGSAPVPSAATPISGIDDLVSIPGQELGTQRVLRLRYDGPEGDGTMKLVMRLVAPNRFDMAGSDRLGRRLWRLAVDDDRALFLNAREKTFCFYGGEIEIAAVPLGPLPFAALPALLLGRLPVRGPHQVRSSDGTVELLDDRGRQWSAHVGSDGALESWILWAESPLPEQGLEPSVYWQKNGSESFLSSRQDQLQLRWQESVRESLALPLGWPEVPDSYEAGDCSPSPAAGSGAVNDHELARP